MDLPNYTIDPNNANLAEENYHEEFNQTLRQNLGPNGFAITNITDADLRTTPILDPNTGLFTTVMDLMPIGTVWFVTDAPTPTWVGKRSSGPTVLRQFTTAAYP